MLFMPEGKPTQLRALPSNFSEFVEEVAAGLDSLYGLASGKEYRKTAHAQFQASLAHPLVYALGVPADDGVASILLCFQRGNIGQVSFIHVLKTHEGRGHEATLFCNAVAMFRRNAVHGILCESVPFCSLNLEQTYRDLGFTTVERRLMMASLGNEVMSCSGKISSQPYARRHLAEMADVIVEAYASHPGRFIHAEVRGRVDAVEFIEIASRDGYGKTSEQFIRVLWERREIAAVLVGCGISQDVGFILQVAVRPRFQRKGIGTKLIREVSHFFRKAGKQDIALGVTLENPALGLYERLGFRELSPVNAYYWWR